MNRMRVPLAPSGLSDEDIAAIVNVLRSGNLTMGAEVASFERDMAAYLGTRHFVMVNSGSSANLAIVEALLRPSIGDPYLFRGDGVLVPAIAWPTTIWPIVQLGLNPIFVDVEQDTFAIDLNKAQELIQSNVELKIRAIFPIHPLGFGIGNSDLDNFATKNNLILINDVCESLGSWQEDIHSGTTGIMSSYSFYFSHHMTTMEGGGVATNNTSVYNDLKSIRSHGWSRDRNDVDNWSIDVHPSMRKFNFISAGYNIRPMEIQAAVGKRQLSLLEVYVQKRRQNVFRVHEAIKDSPFSLIGKPISTPIDKYRRHSWMHIPITIQSKNPVSDRNKVVRYLEDAGIETRPPLTGNFLRQPAMKRFYNNVDTQDDFPVSDLISNSTFLVGCHHDLTPDQVSYLCSKLVSASKLVH